MIRIVMADEYRMPNYHARWEPTPSEALGRRVRRSRGCGKLQSRTRVRQPTVAHVDAMRK